MKISTYLAYIGGFLLFFIIPFFRFNVPFRSSFLIGILGLTIGAYINTACKGTC